MNNYWSATTSVLLSDKMQSTIGGPEPIIDALSSKLKQEGIEVKNKHHIVDHAANENEYNDMNAARFSSDPGALLNSMSLHRVKLHSFKLENSTSNVNTNHFSNYMISIDVGADANIVKHIENLLQKNGIIFSKHDALIEKNHIDFSYELSNISELNQS